MQFQTAQEAISWIHGEQGVRRKGEKDGLAHMRALLARIGSPEQKIPMVHVAGTNGKGSTCAYIESALRTCGYRTGLYTSPYLCRYNERIRVNNVSIPDEDLREIASEVSCAVEALSQEGIFSTTFEIGTAICLAYFAKSQVQIAVIEVGLGGRFDPTNVITPEVCAIAAIGLDHTKILGDTLAQIAMEKAGIIKPRVPVAVYPVEEEALPPILEAASRNESELLRTDLVPIRVLKADARGMRFEGNFPSFGQMVLSLRLLGDHQVHNARLAVCTLALLRERGWTLPAELVERGIEATRWAGRLEWVSKNVLIDGAHNPQGAIALRKYLEKYLPNTPKVLVTGMMQDKQIQSCAKILRSLFDLVVVTRVDYPRAADTDTLQAAYGWERTAAAGSVPAAITWAKVRCPEDGVVVVAGSLYVAGEARIFLTGGELL